MKYIRLFIICFLLINTSKFVKADSNLIKILQKENNLIFIRHSIAPGNGDPKNFDILNCKTQRNLNSDGINQSKKIGEFFKKYNITYSQVLSSEWCRCKDTAKYAFGNFTAKKFLNSFYEKKFAKNKAQQIKDLKNYINNWNEKKNVVFVTHYVVINELLGHSASSGEIVVVDKKLNILGSLQSY